MTITVKIAGKTETARKNRIADLNLGTVLYVGWSGRDSRKNGWEYSISFIDCFKTVYATACEKDKENLANRFDYITSAVVVDIDKDNPRLVIKVLFE